MKFLVIIVACAALAAGAAIPVKGNTGAHGAPVGGGALGPLHGADLAAAIGHAAGHCKSPKAPSSSSSSN